MAGLVPAIHEVALQKTPQDLAPASSGQLEFFGDAEAEAAFARDVGPPRGPRRGNPVPLGRADGRDRARRSAA